MKPRLLIVFFIFFACCKKIDTTTSKPKVDSINSKVENVAKQGEAKSNGQYRTIDKKYDFEKFKAQAYTGKLVDPVFLEVEKEDEEYMAFIKKKCIEKGLNFAGHYTLIEKGCGAMCVLVYIVDRSNGKIFINSLDDGKYGYKYNLDSKLLIANSEVFVDDKLETYYDFFDDPEFYVWENDKFQPLPFTSKIEEVHK